MMSDDAILPVRHVVPVDQMFGEDEEDTRLLKEMAIDAEAFLRSFVWCESIQRRYFGGGIGKISAVFLFSIRPNRPDVDHWCWVVVGDLPYSCFAIDKWTTPAAAMQSYIWEMRRWASLAKQRRTSPHIMPVHLPAAPEWAEKIERKLQFIEQVILPRLRDEESIRA